MTGSSAPDALHGHGGVGHRGTVIGSAGRDRTGASLWMSRSTSTRPDTRWRAPTGQTDSRWDSRSQVSLRGLAAGTETQREQATRRPRRSLLTNPSRPEWVASSRLGYSLGIIVTWEIGASGSHFGTVQTWPHLSKRQYTRSRTGSWGRASAGLTPCTVGRVGRAWGQCHAMPASRVQQLPILYTLALRRLCPERARRPLINGQPSSLLGRPISGSR